MAQYKKAIDLHSEQSWGGGGGRTKQQENNNNNEKERKQGKQENRERGKKIWVIGVENQ